VVATGYEDRGGRPPRRALVEEPAGEPRVERRNRPPERRSRLGVNELDVPEFMPRG
jgi:hypothetical protein